MKSLYERFLYCALNFFGGFCLVAVAFHVIAMVYARISPTATFNPGQTSTIEFLGFGLVSLGIAQVIKLLGER